MADLLTHVLVAYALATLLSIRYERLTPEFVTVAMAGAAVPDLSRMALVFPEYAVESALGVPFSWWAFHALSGSLVAVGIGALFVSSAYRRRALLAVLLGMGSHHVLDLLLVNVTGYSYAVLWPLTRYVPPSPGLYSSTDRWPVVVALVLAVGAWYVRYRVWEEGAA